MLLSKPLVCIDLETTGPKVGLDRIVEVGLVALHPDERIVTWQSRVNPGVPIPPEATAVHGITDSDVAEAPPWAEVAKDVALALAGSDITGFNVQRFDLPLLRAELARVGVSIPGPEPVVVDVMHLYHRLHPRDLTSACREYLVRVHDGAHRALDDARVTVEVLLAMLAHHPELPPTPADLARLVARPAEAYGGKLVERGGQLLVGFGKHTGTPLQKIDSGWLNWARKQDLPQDALDAVGAELERRRVKARPMVPGGRP